MEVDIRCRRLGNEVRIGEGDDWLEILGCGMVHPNVIRYGGHDPEKYQGFAWGMGIDRIAMLKYGMPDLRAFFDADVRWLEPLRLPSARPADAARGAVNVKLTLSWLREHLATDATLDAIVDKLTMIGLEVEVGRTTRPSNSRLSKSLASSPPISTRTPTACASASSIRRRQRRSRSSAAHRTRGAA